MKCTRSLAACLAMAMTIVMGCGENGTLRQFTSDGCSLFPDQSLITGDDWCECCFVHDIAYWQGGTEEQRVAADMALLGCIRSKTGNGALAEMMYRGVRLGGSPYFYNWYRWGYGWSYERKYRELSAAERRLVEQRLSHYYLENPAGYCQRGGKGQ